MIFCGHCGKANPDAGDYCQFCGKKRPDLQPPPLPGGLAPGDGKPDVLQETAAAHRTRLETGQISLIAAIPVPLDRCHRCSALNSLTSLPYALGKAVTRESDYAAMGASVAASAVTLALFGFGAIAGPGRKTTYRTLRMETLLCVICKKRFTDWAGEIKRGAYEFHPWYREAVQLGYQAIIVGGKLLQ